MSVIAFAFASCQKQSTVLPATTGTNNESLSAAVAHYHQGVQITDKHEIELYQSNSAATIYTDKLNGQAAYYYFDTEDQEISFLQQHQELQALLTKVNEAIDLRSYAQSIGEADYYAQHGTNSSAYTNYATKYKARGLYTVFANLGGLGAALFIPNGGVAAFPAFIDNNAESFNSPAGQGLVYKNPFFGGASLGIFATAGPINFVPVWRNVISSAL